MHCRGMPQNYRLAACAAAASVSLLVHPAFADMPLTADLDYVRPLDAPDDRHGFGGGLRFGPRLDSKLLLLAAELGLDVHGFPGDIGPVVYRGVVGTRLGLGWPLRPSIAGHIGVGHADWVTIQDVTHVTADLGLALDVVIVPQFEVGVHGVYNVLFNDTQAGPFEYLTLGAHLTFVFGTPLGG